MRSILDKISYHAVYDNSIMDALKYAKANGFAGIQMAAEAPHLSFENLTDEQCDEIATFRAEQDLSVSLHAPDDLASLYATSKYLSEGIFNYFGALFDFADKIAARLVTVHPGSMTTFGTDEDRPQSIPRVDLTHYRQAFGKNIRRLIDLARGRFILCVESVQMSPMVQDLLQPYLEASDLTLCWDIPKTFDNKMKLNVPLAEWIWRNIEHVRQVHLHDIRDGKSHRALGTGCINFMDFLPRLAEANVLDYCIEVRPREKAAESLAYLKELVNS